MASIEISPDEVEHAIHNVWSRYSQVQAAETQLDRHMHQLADVFWRIPALQHAVADFRRARHHVVWRALHAVDASADDVIAQVADLVKRDVDAALEQI
jgi:hypothetical protein